MYLNTVYKYSKCIYIQYLYTMYLNTAQLWIETVNNEVLKRILEDSTQYKKSKRWETTRKYMNWAQIEEREIKEGQQKKSEER